MLALASRRKFKGNRMKFAVFLASMAALTSHSIASGQSEQSPQSTTLPEAARYEVVQSGLVARWTFRLDRYCGNVAQLVTAQSGAFTWEDMLIEGLPQCAASPRARYQIFTSGLLVRVTVLLDTSNGRAWYLAQDGDLPFWTPFSV